MKLTVIAINEIVIDNKNNPDKFKVFQQIIINQNIQELLLEIKKHKKNMQDLKTKYDLFLF